MKRVFIDAPAWARCGARIILKDGSTARCGRWVNDGYRRNPCCPTALCTQHGNMLFAGKTVIGDHLGEPLKIVSLPR